MISVVWFERDWYAKVSCLRIIVATRTNNDWKTTDTYVTTAQYASFDQWQLIYMYVDRVQQIINVLKEINVLKHM